MATSDEKLMQYLVEELVHPGPGITITNPKEGAANIWNLVEDSYKSADPNVRTMARASLAANQGPKGLRTIRSATARTADRSLQKMLDIEGALPNNPTAINQALEQHAQHFRKRDAMVKLTGRLDQEAARRSDIVRRLMKLIRTQPGLGMILMALLGGGSAIGALAGRE
jgi:hypothetical protein